MKTTRTVVLLLLCAPSIYSFLDIFSAHHRHAHQKRYCFKDPIRRIFKNDLQEVAEKVRRMWEFVEKFKNRNDLTFYQIKKPDSDSSVCNVNSLDCTIAEVEDTRQSAICRALFSEAKQSKITCCMQDDHEGAQSRYNLLENPEIYTGYDGLGIWEDIYRLCSEYSFTPICSGVHSSVNVQLSTNYPQNDGSFGPNYTLLQQRFGEGDKSIQHVKNLLSLLALEARALKYFFESLQAGQKQQHLFNNFNYLPSADELRIFNEGLDVVAPYDIVNGEDLVSHRVEEFFQKLSCRTTPKCDRCCLWSTVQRHSIQVSVHAKMCSQTSLQASNLKLNELTALVNGVALYASSLNRLIQHSYYWYNNQQAQSAFSDC